MNFLVKPTVGDGWEEGGTHDCRDSSQRQRDRRLRPAGLGGAVPDSKHERKVKART